MAESLALPLHEDPGVQGRRHSHPSVQCSDSTGSKLGYFGVFTNAVCTPSLASNGKTTCQTKKPWREPGCPAENLSCFRCSLGRQPRSQGWKMYTYPKQSSACFKKESVILVLHEFVKALQDQWVKRQLSRQESANNHSRRRPQTKTVMLIKPQGKTQGAERASSILIILSPDFCRSKGQ